MCENLPGKCVRGQPDRRTDLPSLDLGYQSSLQLILCHGGYDMRIPSQRPELAKLGYKFDNTTHFIGYKESFNTSTGEWYPDCYDSANNSTISKAASLIPRECVYEINGQVQSGLNEFWQTYFNSNLTSDGDWYNGPSQLEALYNDGDPSFEVVKGTFRNISMSMTTQMRQNGATKYSPATQGTVFKNVTCVRVRWELLVFPAVIAVIMLTFFIGMALDTRNRHGVQGIDHGFKSSPLALMVHGLDSDVQEKLGAPVQQPMGDEKNTIAPFRNDAKKVVREVKPDVAWASVCEGVMNRFDYL